jgi:hypothetical protein
MAIYSPRSIGAGPASEPPVSANGIADGIQIFVNGAGGQGHYSVGPGAIGAVPDVFANDTVCFIRITAKART